MSNKILFVGDPHVQPSNIDESSRLMAFVLKIAQENSCDTLILPGDLFHTHAVIRMEVLNFWTNWIQKFSQSFKSVHLLIGNHDQIGDKQREGLMSALDSFVGAFDNVRVWSSSGVCNGMGFIPYTSNHGDFVSAAHALYGQGARRLFCHQTFDGSKYDNGFYAPDGIDAKLLPAFDEVVSGHIHTEQDLGDVFYPGTAKWDSLSDANEPKGIWVSDAPKRWVKFETDQVCTPIIKKTLTESEDRGEDLEFKENAKVVLELVGSSAWIAKRTKKLKGKCRIVARPTDSVERKRAQTSAKNIFEYLETYKGGSTKGDDLKEYLEKLCL